MKIGCYSSFLKNLFYLSTIIFLPIFGIETVSAAELPTEDEVKGIVRLCSAGQSNAIVANMNAAVSIWKRKVNAEAELRTDEIGAIFKEIQNDQMINEVYNNYVTCVQNSVETFLKRRRDPPTSVGNFFLPKNVIRSPGETLPVLDGKVVVTIITIKEHYRRTLTKIRIEVPRREDYIAILEDGKYCDFQYYEKKYRLTISNPKLQQQFVEVSIREI